MYDTSIMARDNKLYFFKRIHITPDDEKLADLGIIVEDLNETNKSRRSQIKSTKADRDRKLLVKLSNQKVEL